MGIQRTIICALIAGHFEELFVCICGRLNVSLYCNCHICGDCNAVIACCLRELVDSRAISSHRNLLITCAFYYCIISCGRHGNLDRRDLFLTARLQNGYGFASLQSCGRILTAEVIHDSCVCFIRAAYRDFSNHCACNGIFIAGILKRIGQLVGRCRGIVGLNCKSGRVFFYLEGILAAICRRNLLRFTVYRHGHL